MRSVTRVFFADLQTYTLSDWLTPIDVVVISSYQAPVVYLVWVLRRVGPNPHSGVCL